VSLENLTLSVVGKSGVLISSPPEGEMQIQAKNMFDRVRLIDTSVPDPTTPLLVDYTFFRIEEAPIQFGIHAHNSH
jgi:hypothetical protein